MSEFRISLFLCLIVISFFSDISCEDYNDVVNLTNKVLQGYSNSIIPRKNQSEVIKLDMEFSLKALNKFDVVDGKLTMVTAIALKWKDEMLNWNPSTDKNIKGLNVPLSHIWTPNLYLLNCAEEFLIYKGDPNTKEVEIESNGQTRLFFMEVLTTTCATDITYYPNDVHRCKIHLSTLTSAAKLKMGLAKVDIVDFETNGKWKILGIKSEVELLEGKNIERVVISITLERRMLFDIISIEFPVVFLGLVNAIVFKLPVDSGERMSFAMTVFLSFAVYMTLIADKIPQTSNRTSVFCMYLISMLTYSTLITFATTYSINCHHTQTSPRLNVGGWLHKVWEAIRKTTRNTSKKYRVEDLSPTPCMNSKAKDKSSTTAETTPDKSTTKTQHIDNFFFIFFVFYFVASTSIVFILILCR
ncbi:neuronal acetylcholine receptor subunit beta-3-like [Magallana gigas]|uniref:neuronal acetylcholine receptor subunit beta-3-like n=1 Tax=Magallana gigas TaxID=29159 RepID=UPI00333F88AA